MGENQNDKVLADLTVGIQNEHVGQVAGILSNMNVEQADEVVIALKGVFGNVSEGGEGEPFINKVMSKKPLQGKQLAVAILACLRKEPTEGTYTLAQQLMSLAGESPHKLAYDLKAVAAENSYPADQFERFWNEHLKDAESKPEMPEEAAAKAY